MRSIPLLISMCVLTNGCASMFMNGGKLVDPGYAAPVVAAYTVQTCAMADGSTLPGPAGIQFQLVQDASGVGIFERSADGSGAVITNHWGDANADHYFGWVQSSGWEYVIPRTTAYQPVRIVYVGVSLAKEGEVTRPASAPAGTCPMMRVQ